MASDQHQAAHEVRIAAPADAVYRLLADVANWPRIFPPTIHVDRIGQSGQAERIRIWATANGEVKSWTSGRALDPERLRIDFRQEASAPPVAAMGGAWQVEALSPGECVVHLAHDYQAVDAGQLAWIDQAVDRNSRAELAALKAQAELGHDQAGAICSFEDAVRINGRAEDVYDFINEADRWPQRLPHVVAVRLREDVPGLQVLEMDTKSQDGSVHATKSYRVAFPHQRIVYKQVTRPALMSLHTGYWTVTGDKAGVTASSQHTFAVSPASIEPVLGPGAGVADAVAYVRAALSANSQATLEAARLYAESAR
ncbi:MAG TPA: aromatase/cyclase [Trebonia sp.]|nr:aromatase/cyclase [Trebonia sp.]